MPSRRALRQASLGFTFALVVGLASSCRRQATDGDAGPSPAAWTANEPFGTVDGSKTDDEYVAMGVPTPDRNWTSEDMKEAGERLRAAAAAEPGSLPRFRSSRSGKTFARLVAAENLAVFRSDAAPVAIRLPGALTYAHALNGIHGLYTDALRAKSVRGEDLAELHGARLRACALLLELAEEYLPNLSTSDSSYAAKMGGIEAMRRTASDVTQSALLALRDPSFYGLAARKRQLESLGETLPRIVPRLSVDERDAIVSKLRDAAADTRLGNLQPRLSDVSDLVAKAVTARSEGGAP